MAIKLLAEQPINSDQNTNAEISDTIEYIIVECNYKITEKTDSIIAFKPYGEKPYSKNDAVFYI